MKIKFQNRPIRWIQRVSVLKLTSLLLDLVNFERSVRRLCVVPVASDPWLQMERGSLVTVDRPSQIGRLCISCSISAGLQLLERLVVILWLGASRNRGQSAN